MTSGGQLALLRLEAVMGVVQRPDALTRIIDRQVAEGRAASGAEFLAVAVQRYAEPIEADDDAIVAAADAGIADMEAGRFATVSSLEEMAALRAELGATLDQVRMRPGLAPHPEDER